MANNKQTKKKRTKAEKEKLAMRIMAGVMGGLMLLGTVAVLLNYL